MEMMMRFSSDNHDERHEEYVENRVRDIAAKYGYQQPKFDIWFVERAGKKLLIKVRFAEGTPLTLIEITYRELDAAMSYRAFSVWRIDAAEPDADVT